MNLRAFSKRIVAASVLFIACEASYHIGRTSGTRDEQARWITLYTPAVRSVPHLHPPEPSLRTFERLSFQIDRSPHGTLNIVDDSVCGTLKCNHKGPNPLSQCRETASGFVKAQ